MNTIFDVVAKKFTLIPTVQVERRKHNPSADALVADQRRRAHERGNAQHRAIVEAGGGEYVNGMMGDLVLFNSKKTGSTLAIPEKDLTPELVARKLLVSDAQFGK